MLERWIMGSMITLDRWIIESIAGSATFEQNVGGALSSGVSTCGSVWRYKLDYVFNEHDFSS
jgi:hypothetical protein